MIGSKRHLLVDTTGLVLAVVHPADIPDRDGARMVLTRLASAERAQLRHLWVDAGYQDAAVRAIT